LSEPLNLPAEIDVIHRQLDAARDIETAREIHDRAEALCVYCKKHDGLIEAGNRLAGITALGERRIGQELRHAQETDEVAKRRRPAKNSDGVENSSPYR